MKAILLLALCSVAFAALAPSGAPAPSEVKKGQFGSSLSQNLQTLGKTKIEEHLKGEPVFFDRYFIECFPKEAPKVKDCKKWNDAIAAKDGQLFEQLKTMVKEGKDAVDGPTSANNEVISDKAEEKTDQQVANKKMMLLETMAKRSRLPMFHAGRRWPAHAGHKTPIAYCWDNNATWYTRLFFWWSMQIVRWNANNLKFVKVDCNAPGHKIRLRARTDGRCAAQGGGYLGGGALTATVAPAGTASTEQYIGCDFDAYSRYSGAHEMFHALGFGHTQCRSDRDHYLDVTVPIDHQWRVIGNDIGTFDFDSVMLYPPGRNGKPKAKPKAGYLGTPANMGQRTSISAEDARILNQVYN